MSETWLPIPGNEGYSVSSNGGVRSDRRVIVRSTGDPHTVPGRTLSQRVDSGGYHHVSLWRNRHEKHMQVHRIVAEAFIGTCPPGAQVRHLDGNPSNNSRENLAYGTPSENAADQVRHGRHRNASKTHCVNGHEFTPENTYKSGRSRVCRKCNAARTARSKRARADK